MSEVKKDLALIYQTASVKEKLNLCAVLLSSVASSMESQTRQAATTCELARIALAEAIIAEALACGP